MDAQQREKGVEEFRRLVRAGLGEPGRQTGAMEQWNTERGVLTIDPIAGAFFVTRAGEIIRMFRNRNPLEQTLFGSYEMTTPAQPELYWLGNVELRVDATYIYTDSGNFPEQRGNQIDNFFMRNPSGQFELTYLNGFGPATLWESVPLHQRVASVVFRSPEGAEKSFFIAKNRWPDNLPFESDDMKFELGMSW
jgi:hypothetical protein